MAEFFGTGRRKSSVARVILRPGNGEIKVNGKDVDEYFDFETLKVLLRSPLEVTDNLDKFNVIVNVKGGGYTGQAGAIRLGIARALTKVDDSYRGILKREGYLTRDPRKKERYKYGKKKARKSPQFSKR